MKKPVTTNFIDFKKPFDSKHRATVWTILSQYGIPDQVIEVIRNLYNNSRSAVGINGQIGEWFHVITGVHRGCNLSPLLFAIAIDWAMSRAILTMMQE